MKSNSVGASKISQQKNKILFCVTEDGYFATHRFHFAREAIKKGYQVAIACHVSDKREMFEKAGMQVFSTQFKRASLSPFAILKTCWHIRRLVRIYQPQILHAVALRPIFLIWMATIGMKRPPILNAVAGFGTLYSGELKSFKLKMARFVVDVLFKKVFKHSSAYNVLQNSDDFNTLVQEKWTRKKYAFLIRGAGVDPNSWSPKHESHSEKPVVLFVSRLLKDKGLGELVEASRILRDRNVPHLIRVMGDVDDCNPESFSRERVQQWHNSGAIEWLGQRDDVLFQMTQAHLVALPSYYREGLPKVLLEAGLAQRAAITCDAIGCREVVRDRDNGLLVPPRDAVALADAIEKLLKDSNLRHRLAKRNHEKICAEFSSHIIYQQFFDIYEKMLKDDLECKLQTKKIAFVVNAAYTL